MARIFIDDKEYEVDGNKNLLEVCLSLGYDLTYFCWHPALHSVGACRQCGVVQFKDENDTKGKLIMACMQPASDNTRISLKNPKAAEFRAGNIEALMINHPHDCPVCDEGGECHLQDMTLMSGHNYRRYRFDKCTHVNQYLGPFINHEMNRCIQCYRCVRFYKDFAGGNDLDVFASKDHVYFGRSTEGTLESEFSGNLVEVCPTGVFTDKTLRQHYTRKWDLSNAPSICHQCSVGCNIIASERYNGLRRILSRYNGDVNGYFICDRGRFGYEYVNSPVRYLTCRSKQGEVAVGDALQQIRKVLEGGSNVIGIGSPRASLESNYMLKKLVGESKFYNGIPEAEGKLVQLVHDILKDGKVKTPSLAEMAECDAVFVLGEDVTNTAPMMALALRQAAKVEPQKRATDLKIPSWNDAAIRTLIQDEKGPFFIASSHATKLDEIAIGTTYLPPNGLVRLSVEIRNYLRNYQPTAQIDENSYSQKVVRALMKADKPLIVSGTSLMNEHVIKAAANIAYALKDARKDVRLAFAVPEANSMGMPFLTQNYLDAAFEAANEPGTVAVILENDLYERTGEQEVNGFLSKCDQVIVLDSLENKTSLLADFVLPAGTFAESDGTMVNQEGRAQRFYQVYAPKNEIRSSWSWLDALQDNGAVDFARTFDGVVGELVNSHPALKAVETLAPGADYRMGTQKIPREPHRYSGRTAMNANVTMHEPKPPVDDDSPLSFTMEGYHGVPPAPDVPFFWAPGWNSAQAVNKYQTEIGGPLKGGNPGKRLFEINEENDVPFFEITGGGDISEGLTVLPAYHIYGSDELSAKSPPLATRIPTIYFAINSRDGAAYEGKVVEIMVENRVILAPVKIDKSLPAGYAALPKGLNETKGLRFPMQAKIKTR